MILISDKTFKRSNELFLVHYTLAEYSSVKWSKTKETCQHDDGCRVLLVEDSMTAASLLKLMLRKAGATHIDHAVNGEVGLRYFNNSLHHLSNYHLIVIDRFMPVMDGIATTSSIRALETVHHTRPIFIAATSGAGGTGDKAESLAAGATIYMEKPMQKDQIRLLLKASVALRFVEQQMVVFALGKHQIANPTSHVRQLSMDMVESILLCYLELVECQLCLDKY